MRDDRVTILADAVERAEEIDIARAEEARRKAERALQERGETEQLAQAAAALQRALLRLRAAGAAAPPHGRTAAPGQHTAGLVSAL